jgi:alanine racemase
MKLIRPEGLRTWLEIDRKAIKNNFETFRRLLPKAVKFLAVVKSNAYGHNLFEFAKEIERLGADFLGVDSITEASALRREGIKTPILILGYTLPEKLSEAIEKDISVAVSSFETLGEIKKLFLSSQRRL